MDETTHTISASRGSKRKFPPYGIVGGAIVVSAELLLFSNVNVVKIYFTPIVWTGYILFVDSLNYSVHGRSLLMNQRAEFGAMLPWSIVCWLVFEAYNSDLQNWEYIGLPDNLVLRVLGYAWSFATIFPGILETEGFLRPFLSSRGREARVLSRPWMVCSMILGVVFLVLPLVVPRSVSSTMFAFVWVGFFFLLDPLNNLFRRRSVMSEMKGGNGSTAMALTLSGLLCGVLWEFWNYWAGAKWRYTVPISFVGPKVFEMPLLGFLGFMPFAFEVYAMQEFLLVLVPSLDRKKTR